ncbi:hypothetical protein D9M71_703970 [compost metagenome]
MDRLDQGFRHFLGRDIGALVANRHPALAAILRTVVRHDSDEVEITDSPVFSLQSEDS